MNFFDFGRVPVHALDISDQSFKFLRLLQKSQYTTVGDFGEGAIDKGVLENGEIKDQGRLVDILKEVFSENNIKFVALSLPEEKGFLREIRISGVSEDELPQALEFQIEEHIPLPPADVLFDYVVVNKGKDYFDLVVNAFHKNIVESYLNTINSSGALPVLVESELESIARSIIPKNFFKTSMIADWGKTRASFSVFENGTLRFASTSAVGGEELDKSISKTLRVGKNEALKIKFKADIAELKDQRVLDALLPVVTVFAEEIKKILDYWRDRVDSKTVIEQIFLCGGDANLLGLADFLKEKLGTFVDLANPWEKVRFPYKYLPPIKFKESLRFSSTIGLSLKALDKEKIW